MLCHPWRDVARYALQLTRAPQKGKTLRSQGRISTMSLRFTLGGALLSLALVSGPAFGQAKKGKPAPAPAAAAPQKIDEEYTRLIKEYLQDPRITTELVDHMPASDTVPSPLNFLGRALPARSWRAHSALAAAKLTSGTVSSRAVRSAAVARSLFTSARLATTDSRTSTSFSRNMRTRLSNNSPRPDARLNASHFIGNSSRRAWAVGSPTGPLN